MTRAEKLQEILVSYADKDTDKEGCQRIYQRMVDDNLSETDIEKQIVSALSDGLCYGNWPWVNPYWTVHL